MLPSRRGVQILQSSRCWNALLARPPTGFGHIISLGSKLLRMGALSFLLLHPQP